MLVLSYPTICNIYIQGYTDDSSALLSTDKAIRETYKEILKFELATGAHLNKDKTCIMGVGRWYNRKHWPLEWVKTVDCTKVLGIYYYNDFNLTCKENWSIITKIIEISVKKLPTEIISFSKECHH